MRAARVVAVATVLPSLGWNRLPDRVRRPRRSTGFVLELAAGGLPAARYDREMIKNQQAYARQSEEEARAALREMTAEDSIAIGEALLTSDLMRLAQFPDDDHPRSLAIALGLRSTTTASKAVHHHGGE